MAERRRRRSTECDSETEHAEPVVSEYDSTADDSREVGETETDSDEYVTEEEETAEEDEGKEGDGKAVVDGERQSGDGEVNEQPKLDDDEDRQNPAYIPRRGAFYEHDMRLDPDDEEKETGDQARDDKRGKGKLWKDESKWVHDKFDMSDQAPKSRQELVAMYGYDITQFEEPPEEAPKMGGRSRRGGRGSRPQFQDFLPDSGKDRRDYGNRDSYDNDFNDRGVRLSKSDTSNNRGFSRGRRARGRFDGGQSRRNYSDIKDDRAPRNRGFSDRERDFKGHDQDDYGNRDNVRGRDNYGEGDRGNFGRRDRGSSGNDDQYEKDRGYGNRGSRGQYDNKDNRGSRNNDFNDRQNNRGGFRGGRGRGRGDVRDNRRDNRRENRDNYSQQNENRSNRDNVNYDRQNSDNRPHDKYERQNSGGRDRQNYERQSSGGRDGDSQFRKQNEGRARPESEPQQQENSSSRNVGSESQNRAPPTRPYNKPTPKSYYTLSVTDDEKLVGDMEDGEFSPPAKGGISDLNVTVTGDRRSFNKDRPRPQHQRSQDYVQPSGGKDRREPTSPHGPAAQGKHQPTLPPRLQQQQQQQERKRQKQQQQLQQGVSEKQDPTQSRGNKRYSSQRQRAMPEGPGFSEPQISQPPQQLATSQIQQQFQPNFSPTKPGGIPPSVIVRPTISQQISAPPRQPGVASPTMVIQGVPPSMIPVSGQVAQARPQRPPPPAGPQQIGSPPVFAPGTMPSTVMPAVSVIGAPMINPAGMIYAAPPPAFQVPVPQFTGAAAAPQPLQPGETVRGGTTYYPQTAAGSGATPGTTYYSPELQMIKQNRVQVRRPKAPLPIVNPEDIKKDKGAEAASRDEDDEQYLDESSEQIELQETENIRQEPDESIGSVEGFDVQQTDVPSNTEQLDDGGAASSEVNTETERDCSEIEPPNVESENISSENNSHTSENVNRIENISSEENANNDNLESVEEKSSSFDRPTELGIVTDQPEQSLEELDKEIERSSTFVVKTEAITPTLSVSTSIKPEKTEDIGIDDDKIGDSSAIETEQKVENPNLAEAQEKNIEISEPSTKSGKEENDSFEDAVESVD